MRERRRRERTPTPKKADDEARTRRAACANGAGVCAYRPHLMSAGRTTKVPPPSESRSKSPTKHPPSNKTRRSRKTLEGQNTSNSKRIGPRATATRYLDTARRPETESAVNGARVQPSQPRETFAVRAGVVSPHSMFDGRTVKIRRKILSTYELLNDPSGRFAAHRRSVLSGRLAGPGAPNQPRGDGGRKPPGFGSKKWEMVNISPQVTLPVPEPPAGVGRAPTKPHSPR